MREVSWAQSSRAAEDRVRVNFRFFFLAPSPRTAIAARGGSRVFIWQGGAKDYVPARTLQARNRIHIRQGSRSSKVVLMLSPAIRPLFLSILITNWIKNIVDPLFGWGAVAPPGSATGNYSIS